ncbi:MAG: anhydro-N-acetylmuramic acid kinase [Balneolales bacterium]
MHPALEKLNNIASKKERTILGLMSGTSMDGLDIALCRISGSGRLTGFKLDHFITMPYTREARSSLLELTSAERVNTQEVCIWNTWLSHIHADMVNEACREWNIKKGQIDLLASHGHTLYHAPQSKHQQAGKPNATLQIGDGDHLAHKAGIITISDFRQKDTAGGGEGAPLAGYGDYLLFAHHQKERVLINLGGIANFTYIPAGDSTFPPLSMDTGPANTLIDSAMRTFFNGSAYDDGGRVAGKGTVQQDVLLELKNHPYFKRGYPKSTGPEMFRLRLLDEALEKTGVRNLDPQDVIATLTRLTVETLAEAILGVIEHPLKTEIYLSGGGIRNHTLMQWLRAELEGIPVNTTAELGLDPDAKEGVLFAVLANETVSGDGTFPALGKICLP